MRSSEKLYRVTFTCDNCKTTESMELNSGQVEDEGYTGKWYSPPGWVLGHLAARYTGDSIPTLHFCNSDCRESYLQRYINDIQAKFYIKG